MWKLKDNAFCIFEQHLYINLDERTDRRKLCESELKKLDITPERLPAVKHEFGIVGCALSHINAIRLAKKRGWDHICIFEDDLVIKRDNLLKKKVNKLFTQEWDVLMLSGNNFAPFEEFDDYIKVSKCFTTGAYIIKSHYYDTWIDNLNEGIELFLQTKDRKYSLDFYNHKLQERDKWLLITPICCYQREGFSNIENENVDYKNMMLNYDKSSFD